jgi:hypothetical protein
MPRLVNWTSFYLSVCLISTAFSSDNGPFCDPNSGLQGHRLHPQEPPEQIFAPWIWEAVHRHGESVVQVTVVPRSVCSFNESRWRQTVRRFPQYRDQLGDGKLSNRLVTPIEVSQRDRAVEIEEISMRARTNTSYHADAATLQRLRREDLAANLKGIQLANEVSMQGERISCLYYKVHPSNQQPILVGQTRSEAIRGTAAWMSLGTIEVFCPLPVALQGPVRDQKGPHDQKDSKGFTQGPKGLPDQESPDSPQVDWLFDYMVLNRTYLGNVVPSRPFGVCRQEAYFPPPTQQSSIISATSSVRYPLTTNTDTKASTNKRKTSASTPTTASSSNNNNIKNNPPPPAPSLPYYALAVCAATDRSHRPLLVEWLEHLALLGVGHAFLYNTAAYADQHRLTLALVDYLSEGWVTVVPWAYESCFRGMASGRFLEYQGE